MPNVTPTENFLNDMRIFLKYVDIAELHEKICRFRDLDFKRMSYQEIQSAVTDVINFNTPHGNISILTPGTGTYPIGTRFYRVRSMPQDDRNLPLRTMSKISDCWEPPANIVGAGRLNQANEPLLYTAPMDPITAIEEMKIPDNHIFSLIVYEAISPINCTIIGGPPNTSGLTDEEKLKSRMIQDFLKHEFIRDVGVGTEYLYRISESITKDYFDLPPSFQDAWCYPSVASKGSWNVCFRAEKRTKLSLIGVQIVSIVRNKDGYACSIRVIAAGADNTESLEYHQIGSDMQKNLFPDIVMQ